METEITDPYETTYNGDGTVTVWDSIRQMWLRDVWALPIDVWATLSDDERKRIERHLNCPNEG